MIKVSLDVLILTECWLSKIVNLPILDGYSSYHTRQTRNQNDGIAIYIKNLIKYTINEPELKNGNCLTCEINNRLAIISLYRSPSYNTKEGFEKFLSSLDNILTSFSKYTNICLIGDVNIDIKPSNIRVDERSRNDLTLNATHGLLPAHYLPTRINSCIDHVILKTNKTTTVLVLESHITDHLPSLVEIDVTKPLKQTAPLFKIPKIDYTNVKIDIESLDFSLIIKTTLTRLL